MSESENNISKKTNYSFNRWHGFGRRLDVIDPNGKHLKIDLNDLSSHSYEKLRKLLIECGISEKDINEFVSLFQLADYATKKGIVVIMMEYDCIQMYLPNELTKQSNQEFKSVVQEIEEKENNSQDNKFNIYIKIGDMFYEGKENDYMHIGDVEGIIEDTGVLGDMSMGEKR